MSKKLIYLMSLVLVLAVMGTALADQQAITIENPGFEDPVLAEDDWTWIDVPGWTPVGGEAPGIWNVTLSDFDPVIAPEGENVLYTENAVGDGAGVTQILTESFAADTDYTLTADVGNSWSYYFAGYSVQLLAGGIVIAEDNDTLWPDYMIWATSTVAYTYDPADSALVGQPLEIRLLNLGLDKDNPPDGTVGVEFDNVTLSSDASADPGSLSGLADVTVVDGAIVSLRHDGAEYVVADGDLALGTTTRWYIVDGVETLWIEGDPAPAETVSGTSTVKEGDVGSNADNFTFAIEGDPDNISSIDGIDFQETIFAAPTDTIFLFERGGNDKGSLQAILADGSLGAEVAFDKASDGGPYADTGDKSSGQGTFGVVFTTDVPMIGVRITASGHDTLSISAPAPESILVDPNSDLAAANELAQVGDTIEFAEGTYYITSQIEIKDGVTYRGTGPGLTIIDGNDVTRAFVAWGDRSVNEGNENPNDSGPKGWVLEGMTIQNCVADTTDRFSYAGAALNMKDDFVDNDADASGGLDIEEADADDDGIRLNGEDGAEGTEDDDSHRFTAMDTDGNGELSEVELDAQLLSTEVESGDKDADGGAITIHNGAVGTIANCDFLANYTPAGGGDDGGAVNITSLSVITINDCWFDGNYAVSPNSVAVDGSDGDAGHIKVQGNTVTNGFINVGTTLIANRCAFLNGNAEDDAGAIQSNSAGVVTRLDACWFEGNTAWDNGSVLQFPNEDQNEATVTNCVFANNITNADNSPDRMIETRRNSKFINCTFVGNIQEDQDLIYNNANNADGDNDGADDELADATQVINCLFVNNVVGNGDDVLGSRNANFTIAATNCLFFGNLLQDGSDADNTQRPADEAGSILADPLLDAQGIPGAGSPAIDAGIDPATVGVTLTTDHTGQARPQGATYDIGAYEAPAN